MEMGSTISGLSKEKSYPKIFQQKGPLLAPKVFLEAHGDKNFKRSSKGGPLKSVCLDLPRSTLSGTMKEIEKFSF